MNLILSLIKLKSLPVIQWLIKHKRIAIEAILTLAVALSLCYASVVKAQKDRAL
jgi:hypothetical protein